ncbi:extracellular solute-binding protein [uncultured Sphaerochaeta sp.]|uniref:ABC transporter substrate-binding protein n=1 Tax=uncultured Sphaerochaeta sp. TaxID=886478 RepID=UPI002A0A830C|nr:extracellular solute-binding protein [uncultured Sphaerochaeta sp.]
MKRFLLCLCLVSALIFPTFANGEKEKTTAPAIVDETELSQEDLIAAAQKEGKLVVYGTHSYIEKAAAAFQEKYGIQVSWTQLGETDLIQKISAECSSNAGGADLVYAQDGSRIKGEWINQNYIYNWKSKRLGALTGNEDMSMSVFEYSCKAFIWNNELESDGKYLSNIWQITDPQYKGLFSMKDPYAEGVNFNFFTMLTSDENATKMAKAYKDYYGKDIALTTPNAGYEWIKAAYKNGMILGTSDTKISEEIGAKGQSVTRIGLFAVQRFATAKVKNLALAMNTGMDPYVGFYYPIYSIILKQSTHKNAAKLFVEFMLSEDGWQFWKNNVGDYSANKNLPYAGDISFDQWSKVAVLENMDFVYQNRVKVEDFIVGIN